MAKPSIKAEFCAWLIDKTQGLPRVAVGDVLIDILIPGYSGLPPELRRPRLIRVIEASHLEVARISNYAGDLGPLVQVIRAERDLLLKLGALYQELNGTQLRPTLGLYLICEALWQRKAVVPMVNRLGWGDGLREPHFETVLPSPATWGCTWLEPQPALLVGGAV